MTTEAIEDAMKSLTEALEPKGMAAAYTVDPKDDLFGRIEFSGNTWKHRFALHCAGATPAIGSKVFFMEDYRLNLVAKAHEVIRQLSR
jgi:hypothetical protein